MTKEIAQIALDNMPEKEFELDDFFERLIFMEKVEEGRKDAREGRTVTLEQAKKLFDVSYSK